MSEIQEILNKIDRSELDYDNHFEYSKICSRMLRGTDKEQSESRRILIHILANWENVNDCFKPLWTDLVESAGFYPYLIKENLELNNFAELIRTEFHKSRHLSDKYYHEEQKILSEILDEGKNLIVSAPTSFGKSLLIEDIVASGKYQNIVVIQPTLALLDETRKKLKKYADSYKIIIKTSQLPSEDMGNLFLLTSERVMEYEYFPETIDLLILDEFYKLSAKRDDERSDTLNNAFNLLVNKYGAKFYLLGPNIKGISEGFAERYGAEFYKTDYSLVDIESIDCFTGHKKENKELKKERLFKLLLELQDEQTIIYCSSPSKVNEYSREFQKYLEKHGKGRIRDLPLLEWIRKYIGSGWNILDCLEYGIGIHNGALQKHITTSIIDYFNTKQLNYLFCTSTIIEGVNTTAKNIVYFDKTKGSNKKLDFFDYCNIKGRSGRMMEHYIGKIYNFNEPPKQEDIIIDIPFFEQNPISCEVLVHLSDEEVKKKDTEDYLFLKSLPKDERDLFKRNGISIKGQYAVLREIRDDLRYSKNLIIWRGIPTSDQLKHILTYAWNNFSSEKENRSQIKSLDRLALLTDRYIRRKSIIPLINDELEYHFTIRRILSGEASYAEMKKYGYQVKNPRYKKYPDLSEEELMNNVIISMFQIHRHWFGYTIPKWLSVINNLQKHVCAKNEIRSGDYSYIIQQIESGFVQKNLSILDEYGIPTTALDKLERYIDEELDEEAVFERLIKSKCYQNKEFLEYERYKIEENIFKK
ncbi:DEAD/DEAH box helicase [Methanococcus maripaludis]|uniref:Helicase n=1 Tax=Methanococcus maripaludis TaxID=39152 RepID=A0A7J9PQA7_METMI|nr:DEAD/DEAH box helicase [Methanococcus maripaludis]MBA2864910.1 hypothetical protein [Methanococcus maripaludis]